MAISNLLGNIDVNQLNDMTQVQTGGGSRGLLPAGTAIVRLCSYIEFGSHVQEFNGQKKPPAPIFQLGFRIVAGGGLNLEGKPEKYVLEEGQFPLITTYDTTMSLHEKAKAVKYFNALNRVGNKATHFVQKLQEQCLYALPIGVKKNKHGKDVNDIDFTNLQPALNQETYEPRTGDPELNDQHIQVFLWEQPTKEMWDSLYIEGTWEAKKDDAGNILYPAKSKNFLQEKCLTAINFEGSALQTLLQEIGADYKLPDLPSEAPADVPPAPPADVPAIPEGSAVSAPPEAPALSDDDLL